MLDVGTGSGILAIAAAKLGFRPVVALDFDPECVIVARANSKKNRVRKHVSVSRGDVARLPNRRAGSYPVVCANLTANLLQQHAVRLKRQVARAFCARNPKHFETISTA
jgi:ribosomal protein L11 methyltransferase